MSNYSIVCPARGRLSRDLGPPIAQGAAGTIHHVIGEAGLLAKLYIKQKDLPEYKLKIEAMLAARPNLPPFLYNGRNYVQIAWPVGMVYRRLDFVGFVMPEVDFQASTELDNVLQKAMRTRKAIPEFYGARVLLAANLAALLAELHKLGHYMVDVKPVNMRFYPGAWYMAILDTDGFSINGRRRYPARQFSDEYIAPEARGKPPETLGLEEDLFALATIIFQLMNNGLHPFQGIDTHGNHPTSVQERIFAKLYPYGLTSHPQVNPSLSSIHEFLERETRLLFDRAFLSTTGRPTAREWRNHLRNLLTNKVLVRCKASNDHAHFSKGCGLCALTKSSGRSAQAKPTGPIQLGPAVIGGGPSTSRVFIDWLKQHKKIGMVAVGALVVALWLFVSSLPSPPTTAPQPLTWSPPSSAPQPVPPPPSNASKAVKPSFDCAKARLVVETLICNDVELAALDRVMAETYRAVKGTVSPDRREHFRREQLDWLAQRNSCQSGADPRRCVKNLYFSRTAELRGYN
jgi:uncharacterized protein YecT (DUF1311 family)